MSKFFGKLLGRGRNAQGEDEDEELARIQRQREADRIAHEAEMKRMQDEFAADMARRTQQAERERIERDQRYAAELQAEQANNDAFFRGQDELSLERKRQQGLEDARSRREREDRERQRSQAIEEERKRGEAQRVAYQLERDTQNEKWTADVAERDRVFAMEKEEQERRRREQEEKHAIKMAALRAASEKEWASYQKRLADNRRRLDDFISAWKTRHNESMQAAFEMLAHRVWNAQVERKWATRLGDLRSLHDPVRSAWLDTRWQVESLTQDRELAASRRAETLGKLTILVEALQHQGDAMRDEEHWMRNARKEHPEAHFLVDIAEAANAIEVAGSALLATLKLVQNHLTNEFATPLGKGVLKGAEDGYRVLEKAVDAIPAVYALKNKYQGKGSSTSQDEEPIVDFPD